MIVFFLYDGSFVKDTEKLYFKFYVIKSIGGQFMCNQRGILRSYGSTSVCYGSQKLVSIWRTADKDRGNVMSLETRNLIIHLMARGQSQNQL